MAAGADEELWRMVESKRASFVALSDQVWATPELCYNEHRSAAAHLDLLKREGFRVTSGVAGIPTAMIGEAGAGGPLIAVLGEYDALPGLSQEAGSSEHRPIAGVTAGHGCGHNLLGAGALLAASTLKDWLASKGIPGRVRYYGCPAEEGGAAKGFMTRDGAFDDVDIAITWHPACFPGVWEPVSLANMRIDFAFTGRAAHAATAPHLGRSALDACELMNVGVNYLREHMPSDARVHYAYLDAGGIAPNVVQAHAKLRYLIRARTLSELKPLVGRVRKIAEGAALMTETTVHATVISAVSDLLPNAPLEEALYTHLMCLGPPPFTDEDRALAATFQKNMREEDIAASYRRQGMPIQQGKVRKPFLSCALFSQSLADSIVPISARGAGMVGSTDVGDVSWKVPTVQARGATWAIGTPGHSWLAVAQGKTSYAHTAMVHVAKALAATAAHAFLDVTLIARAKVDHNARTGGKPYDCPLPSDAKPALNMSLAE